MELQAHRREVYVPGSILVANETMVGWKGATNIHITILPDKPTGKGVSLKTLADGRTLVLTELVFVESKERQGSRRYAEEGKAAAVALRLIEPWHNSAARIVIANSWFGGMPTAWGLMQRGPYSILNAKTNMKYFCKKELWAAARGKRRNHARNDRVYHQLSMQIQGRSTTFTGAFHMDKRPMTLLRTAG
jgi:hypothetical protein